MSMSSFAVVSLSLLPLMSAGRLVAADGGTAARVAPQLLPPVRNGAPVPLPGLGAGSPLTEEPTLVPAKDGSGDLTYEAPGFSARVQRDGAVSFRDKKLSVISLLPFMPGPALRNVPSLQTIVTGILRNRRVPPVDGDAVNDSSYMVIPLLTPYRPDPREGCRACNIPMGLMPISVTMRADLTDAVMSFSGQDPYRYQKALFLAVTQERRVKMAARTHAENIRLAASELPRRLRAIACDETMTVRERRQILATLQKELDAPTPQARAAAEETARFLRERSESHDGSRDGAVGDAEPDLCPAAGPRPGSE